MVSRLAQFASSGSALGRGRPTGPSLAPAAAPARASRPVLGGNTSIRPAHTAPASPLVTAWDRFPWTARREMLRPAPKPDRVERAVLAQDSDAQVRSPLLKNPRLTADEVIRIAKSPFLTFQTAEAIMKSTQWLSNLEVRVARVKRGTRGRQAPRDGDVVARAQAGKWREPGGEGGDSPRGSFQRRNFDGRG